MPSLQALSDHALLARAGDGDPTAFAQLYDRHHRQAFGIALRICRQREAAEDTVQQAFLEIWRHAHRFDASRGTVGSWIATVVHCRAIDTVRRQNVAGRRVADHTYATEPATPDFAPGVSDQTDSASVRRALRRLPPKQQTVLLLSYHAGLSHVEIASRLGIPLGTVKGRARLGLHTLRATPEVLGLTG